MTQPCVEGSYCRQQTLRHVVGAIERTFSLTKVIGTQRAP
jgi:hypothetical protein